ncbi:hypothetical protein VHA01S_023_00020 [Vibrio halioticoli NBRC 102217]|uniref:Uncharacterized protein n=1 Tax=Vibrio halioticoli NBRC 102217 TaxID=1219072 RepID=V5FDC4_9VIBR|nr:hypothetical protein [Vibrio halioticoli]GAD89588.1 hypothetical protein VHA01S_023_00020 [Vibrio halioticoli NBRC 102217]
MILHLASNTLLSTDGSKIKQFSCPLEKNWEQLSWTKSEFKRFCSSCDKHVIDLTTFTEEQIIAIFKIDPDACAYIDFRHSVNDIRFISTTKTHEQESNICGETNRDNLLVINTARDVESINRAVKLGYKVIIKPTVYDECFGEKVIIKQDEDSGEYIIQSYDLRSLDAYTNLSSTLQANLNSSPFAAYLIPKDLPKNTKVFMPDLIEHTVADKWQGNEYRKKSSEGIWDGEEIIIEKTMVFELLG